MIDFLCFMSAPLKSEIKEIIKNVNNRCFELFFSDGLEDFEESASRIQALVNSATAITSSKLGC